MVCQVASSDVMAAYFWKRKKRGSNPTRCERLPKSLLLKVITISEEQFEPANEMENPDRARSNIESYNLLIECMERM